MESKRPWKAITATWPHPRRDAWAELADALESRAALDARTAEALAFLVLNSAPAHDARHGTAGGPENLGLIPYLTPDGRQAWRTPGIDPGRFDRGITRADLESSVALDRGLKPKGRP